jgi:hypothetical protein
LVLKSSSASEAGNKAKELLVPREKILSINVLNNDVWMVIKGVEIKGKTIQLHGRSDEIEEGIDPLTDALLDQQFRESPDSPKVKSSNAQSSKNEETEKVPTGGEAPMPVWLAAIVEAFSVCVMRVFTISLSIWKGSAHRLAKKHERGDDDDVALRTDTEFPVFEWMKASWDGVIFLSWFVMPLIVIYAAGGDYRYDWGTFWIGMILTYFMVIPLSLSKEALVLLLSIALNVERISYKTSSSSKK